MIITTLFSLSATCSAELAANAAAEMSQVEGQERKNSLDTNNRPVRIQKAVDENFENLRKMNESCWDLYNGAEMYGIAGVDENRVVSDIVRTSKKTELYFLDIGAGNFQWGRAMSQHINNNFGKSHPDIRVHIIGVRGEQWKEEEVMEDGVCKIYEYGGFKVEDLDKVFLEKGLDLSQKLDLVVSHYTFCHLTDPVGTFVKTYNLMTQGGIFLCTNFSICLDDDHGSKEHELPNFKEFLLNANVPFCMAAVENCQFHMSGGVLVQKQTDGEMEVPLSYRADLVPYFFIGTTKEVTQYRKSNRCENGGAQVQEKHLRVDMGYTKCWWKYFVNPKYPDVTALISKEVKDES